MNTTVLIIGIVVVLLLIVLLLILFGMQRRKSKTVSFEKPAEDEPKELTQQEKSGNYQAAGGFNFAPAKSPEKEPEVLPGQNLKPSGSRPVSQADAQAAAQPRPEPVAPEVSETPKKPVAPQASETPEATEGRAAETRAMEERADAETEVAPAVSTAPDAASRKTEPVEVKPPAETPVDTPAEKELTAEAVAGDLAEAEAAAKDDSYHVVEESAPEAPVENASYQVVEESAPEIPAETKPRAAAAPSDIPVIVPVETSTDTPAEEPVEAAPVETPAQPEPVVVKQEAEEAAAAAAVTAEGVEAALEQTPVPDAPAEPAPTPRDEIAPAAGRIGKLRSRLSRSQNAIGQGVLGILTAGDLDEDAWEEIEDTLIMADLGTTVTMRVVDSLREKIAERGVSNEAEARAMLRETLIEAARPELDRSIKAMPYEGKPAVVLVVGVNGTGKTTTTGKLARVLVSMGHKVLLGAADTFRAAAADQLETWGSRVGAKTVRGAEGADPASVAFDTVARGIEEQADVVLIDTAGRLHTSTGLMDQLGKVKRVVEKKAAVDEVLLVLDATVGQNGLIQARTFREVVDITGVVLTKLDGTAKGGIVFQVQEELGVPVKLVGLGEGADHLAPFEVEGFVDALLG
ncbi:Signal recognition particle receptor FtsY [Corynebacterium occultum]|uniref:Signal recognition particle receptor FtsY n=1 Tax=Corynebacterium occultum TaxID=2675219 RepID=A0A6B8WN10_9CORY|nr:signal recognition particle-docking protein FtsY [Corynebacterium occultum]QGU07728.1 Signal recognition particle receptor FtsY [Corynebacterium occultum]